MFKYAELVGMSRSELITAQEIAMSQADHDTLRKIAMVLVNFQPKALRQEAPKATYIKEEVEDITNFQRLDKKDWKTSLKFWGNK